MVIATCKFRMLRFKGNEYSVPCFYHVIVGGHGVEIFPGDLDMFVCMVSLG